jgi:phosphate transport system substrate-binding protein
MIFGFADARGEKEHNLSLSEERAKEVAQTLRRSGSNVHISLMRFYGSQLPVGSNDTEEGREKNRRVEIWVRDKTPGLS